MCKHIKCSKKLTYQGKVNGILGLMIELGLKMNSTRILETKVSRIVLVDPLILKLANVKKKNMHEIMNTLD